MSGILYGVGVGPGDPEEMTLKAVRTIRENRYIAVPGKEVRETVAYKIAAGAVPELAEKELIALEMPMIKNREEIENYHDRAADQVEEYLKKGENVVFLTLGDPTVYSTYMYIHKRIRQRGYETRVISGIPSFCAAAARMNIPLTEWNEELHVIPAAHNVGKSLDYGGTRVLMKCAKKLPEVKEKLSAGRERVYMAENCGMENEHIYTDVKELPDEAGYYSLVIVKQEEEFENFKSRE